MRLGLATWSYHRSFGSGKMTLENFIGKAFELGLDGVELNDRFLSTDKSTLNKIKKLLSTYGLGLSQITVDNNFCLPTEGERQDQLHYVKNWVDATYHLGSPIMRINAGWPPKNMNREEVFAYALQGIKETVEYAEKYGITITLENHGGVAATSQDLIEFLKDVGSDWFKVNLDTGNFQENRYGQIEQLIPHTAHVHAKIYSLKRDGDGNWTETTLDYNRIFSLLRRANYHYYLSLEYEGVEDELVSVPFAVEFLRKFLR
jgi:L-ribulose-5-phosphate 3-epimerase